MTLKTRLALVGALTVAAASFAPATIAGAQDESPAPESGSKTVVESETGSYIVVMAADPLTATIAADDLDTPAADAQAAVLEESHDEVARRRRGRQRRQGAGLHELAQRLLRRDEPRRGSRSSPADPDVALVLPDELRHVDRRDVERRVPRPHGSAAAPTRAGSQVKASWSA